ncbi:hypothetical protein PF010_g2696 [Phytophthora fragariae]|uniref:Secreted protein n=1 Tax=Phytophthora fragariae TaxID=53985 RepID=A0A6G0LWB5_9STRA|nr:hypothetical protein PF010_g2696 [Phytophthora fragariae]KAE9251830.1 hypothetical protein PF004_g2279 [Phytophthora fragariae]
MRHRLLLVAAVPVLHIVKFTERHNVDSVRSDARKVTCISGNTSSNSCVFSLETPGPLSTTYSTASHPTTQSATLVLEGAGHLNCCITTECLGCCCTFTQVRWA